MSLPEKFILEKPQIKHNFTLNELKEKVDELQELIYKSNNPEYLYWTDIKYKNWIKEKIEPSDFWQILDFSRSINSNVIYNFKTENNKNFLFNNVEHFNLILKEIDNFKLDEINYNEFFIKNNLIEEAISSSQLEGAHTTREIAKKIIKQKRQAVDESQNMIINNFEAMEVLQNKYKFQNLSVDMILELHEIFLKNDKKISNDKIGCFRENKENIYIGNELYYTHIAPNIEYVKEELNKLVYFANNIKTYHPIITAIIIHGIFAYLHPFVDGNGRISRCLFYWYLMKNNYEYMICFPISRVIKKLPNQYSNSFIYFQQNNFDMSYIIDYNLRKILQAKNEFLEYYNKKTIELDNINNNFINLIKEKNINSIQEELFNDLISNKIFYLTIQYVVEKYKITRQTASNYLKNMEKESLLISKKVGKEIRYHKNEFTFS